MNAEQLLARLSTFHPTLCGPGSVQAVTMRPGGEYVRAADVLGLLQEVLNDTCPQHMPYNDAVTAMDAAYWLSGTLAQRITALIREREQTLEGPHPVRHARGEVTCTREGAVRVWHKHCDPFVSVLGKEPPNVIIDAMLEFARKGDPK